MCGIIGLIGQQPVLENLLQALERLEYRGYDSAGVALFEEGGVEICRTVGRLSKLRETVPDFSGTAGIGHTRWATHGIPEERNAHPHQSRSIILVHNGIIENFAELKDQLIQDGYGFQSDTDTEALSHLLDRAYSQYGTLADMMKHVFSAVQGTFAIVGMLRDHPELLFGARRGSSPLVVGYGEDSISISSDALGLVGLAKNLTYMEEDTWVILRKEGAEFFTMEGTPASVSLLQNPFQVSQVQRGDYDHFMLKEIYEQPGLMHHLYQNRAQFSLKSLIKAFKGIIPPMTFMGCGTAFHACWIGKYFWEALVGTPAQVELASEFHLRSPKIFPGFTLVVSQSGETADTLKAAEIARENDQILLGIVNVPQSSLARLVDEIFYTQAGPEIGVASTKAFTAQLWALLALALSISPKTPEIKRIWKALEGLPNILENVFALLPQIQSLAKTLSQYPNILYLGRGPNYPLALEGALKMKELSYIHAEGIAAGELKHGSIALIHEKMPVLILLPQDRYFQKTLSNLHEVAARKGLITVLTTKEGATQLGSTPIQNLLILPTTPCGEFLNPFVYALVLQLLAYYTAHYLGHSVDNPRNLAKSVTVY